MSVEGTRLRVTPNLAYGICLVIVGTALVLDRLQIIAASQVLRYWPLGLVLLGLTLIVQSLQRPDSATTAPARDGFNPGPVIIWVLVALFFTQGFSRGEIARTESSETVNVFAMMGRHQQLSRAPVFRGGEVTSVMGRADLDLRNTTVTPEEAAVIEVFTLMGGTTIRVPEGWTVDVHAARIMGGIRDRRDGHRDVPGAPRIVIRGFVIMGHLDIRS